MAPDTTQGLPARQTIILIVGEDSVLAHALQQLLQEAGYAVQQAADLPSLVRAKVDVVDLVLLDLFSGTRDILKVCLWLRAYESSVYLPIIALTAADDAEQRHASFTAGADDVVAASCDGPELLARVQAWLRCRQRLQAAQERLVAQEDLTRGALRQSLDELERLGREWEAVFYPAEDARRVQAGLERSANHLAAALAELAVAPPEEPTGAGYTSAQLN